MLIRLTVVHMIHLNRKLLVENQKHSPQFPGKRVLSF